MSTIRRSTIGSSNMPLFWRGGFVLASARSVRAGDSMYPAVDKAGATVDFLLTAKRDCKAALRFLRKANRQRGEPQKITIDRSGANTAAIERYKAEHEADIEIRRIRYLNNIVEQDHRAVKRVTRPMLGFEIISIGCCDALGDRAHAFDPKGTVAGQEQISSSTAVLCPRRVSHVILTRSSHP